MQQVSECKTCKAPLIETKEEGKLTCTHCGLIDEHSNRFHYSIQSDTGRLVFGGNSAKYHPGNYFRERLLQINGQGATIYPVHAEYIISEATKMFRGKTELPRKKEVRKAIEKAGRTYANALDPTERQVICNGLMSTYVKFKKAGVSTGRGSKWQRMFGDDTKKSAAYPGRKTKRYLHYCLFCADTVPISQKHGTTCKRSVKDKDPHTCYLEPTDYLYKKKCVEEFLYPRYVKNKYLPKGARDWHSHEEFRTAFATWSARFFTKLYLERWITILRRLYPRTVPTLTDACMRWMKMMFDAHLKPYHKERIGRIRRKYILPTDLIKYKLLEHFATHSADPYGRLQARRMLWFMVFKCENRKKMFYGYDLVLFYVFEKHLRIRYKFTDPKSLVFLNTEYGIHPKDVIH